MYFYSYSNILFSLNEHAPQEQSAPSHVLHYEPDHDIIPVKQYEPNKTETRQIKDIPVTFSGEKDILLFPRGNSSQLLQCWWWRTKQPGINLI